MKDLDLIRSSLFDCFQADGSVGEISDNNPQLPSIDRFNDSGFGDDVDLRNVSTSSRLSTSKWRPKDNKRSQPNNTQCRSYSRPQELKSSRTVETGFF